jgi:hypothetical protein
MAPRSLLRHIFRHGPYAKAHNAPTPSKARGNGPNDLSKTLKRSISQRHLVTPDSTPDSTLTYKLRSESRQSSVLEDIAEESEDLDEKASYHSSETDYTISETDSDMDKTSVADTLAALQLSLENFTTRNLVMAALNEARIATYAHLDTIETSLALLEVLEGLSATIAVLEEEMLEKREMCKEKLHMLEDVERVVARMQFGEETLDEEE